MQINGEDIIIVSHNNGGQDNIHFADNNREEIKGDDEINHVHDHKSHTLKTVKEFREHSLQYGQDNTYLRRFPPSEDLKESYVKELGDLLEHDISQGFLGDPEHSILLTGYDCLYHLELYNKLPQGNINMKHSKHFNNSVFLIDWSLGIVAVFMVCESEADFNDCVQLCNTVLKAIYTLFYERITNTGTILCSCIYLPHFTRSDLSCRMFLNGDFSSEDDVCSQLLFLVKREKPSMKVIRGEVLKLRTKVNGKFSSGDNLQKVAYEMMATMALTNETLPCFHGDSNKKISTLLFSTDQWKIVGSTNPLKIITSCYGSGKTLILKRIARNTFLENIKGTVFYICFDPFSFLDVQVEKEFENWKDQKLFSKVNLVSINLKDLASMLHIEVNDMFNSVGKPKYLLSELITELSKEESGQNTFLLMNFQTNRWKLI